MMFSPARYRTAASLALVLPVVHSSGAALLAAMGHTCASWRALVPAARDAALTDMSERMHRASLGLVVDAHCALGGP